MIRLAALSLALLLAGCKTCPALDFPRAADVAAITAPRPKIPPAALDPENPTAAANYQSADRAWSKAVSDSGGRICRYLARLGMPGIVCPPALPDDAAARGGATASER
ncbi:hypothetical protein [Novosphingobium sp. TCA1]|uniref:hypothetical protein n=1 Tax=Novosphingobium sp. TCA1 TaxID=2682474 RepID=UPI00130798A5|nr:hypothetical protein [Novosphingobium sp. TCA1]GFE73436.1 hypothetical protein NTCA1_10850 [Novosphingobium sp. TCA1]